MSVKIEILDYKYYQGNIITWSNSSISGWTTGTGITANTGLTNGILISSTSGSSGAYSGFDSPTLTLQNKHSYTFKYTCVSLNNASQTNSQIFMRGTGSGLNTYRPFSKNISTGTYSYTFTMDTSQNNGAATMSAYFELTQGNNANKNIKIKDVSLVDNTVLDSIDWEKSMVGELDATDHSEFPLALTFQISEIKDVTSTTGDYSKSFKIPATSNNNKLLKNIYTPNVVLENNATKNKPCRILVDNLFSLVGTLKVSGIGGYGERASYYNCIFYGNNLGWANGINEKYLTDIDWGADGQDIEYKKPDIMATWQDEHCSSSTSPIVYPIASYGRYNQGGESNTIQLLDTAWDYNGTGTSAKVGYYGFFNSGTDYGTPEPVADWRPAIFVKDTIEKIFAQASLTSSYTINSTFMNTDMFKKLVWLLPNFLYNNSDKRYNKYSIETKWGNNLTNYTDSVPAMSPAQVAEAGVFEFSDSSLSQSDGTTYYTGASRELVDIYASNLTITLDNGSYVDYANDQVTIGEYGYYEIKLNGLECRAARIYKGGGAKIDVYQCKSTVNVEVQTVGQSSWNIIESAELTMNPKNAAGGTGVNSSIPTVTSYKKVENINIRRYLNKGDKIRLTKGARLNSTEDSTQNFQVYFFWRSTTNSNFNIELESKRVEYGQTYNLQDIINPDYKQIDFIKGIAHAFNLKMTTDEVAKTVNIEPANTFYEPYAQAIDWTYKLDRSRETKDKFLKTDLKRNLVFKYKTDDKDARVKFRGHLWFKGIEDEFPYQESLPSSFEKGDSIFENPFFAGTYNSRDRTTTGAVFVGETPFSPFLSEGNNGPWDTNRSDKGYEFLPRLLYWNKYSPAAAPAATYKKAIAQTWDGVYLPIVASALFTSASESSNIYPQATSINKDDVSSPVLSYGNTYVRDYNSTTQTYSSITTEKGLYETYYKSIFEMFKQNPRIRVVYIDLKISDIVNLDFKKLIYLDECYWRLNKIIDYMPNKNQPTKVELIEWIELGAFASTPSIVIKTKEGIGNIETSNNDMGL